jgi:hypothetical protein
MQVVVMVQHAVTSVTQLKLLHHMLLVTTRCTVQQRGAHTLKRRQYQIVRVLPGLLQGEERERWKVIDGVQITL